MTGRLRGSDVDPTDLDMIDEQADAERDIRDDAAADGDEDDR